jgi:hypothetical protein
MEVEPGFVLGQISIVCFCENGGEAWDFINVMFFCHQTLFETPVSVSLV